MKMNTLVSVLLLNLFSLSAFAFDWSFFPNPLLGSNMEQGNYSNSHGSRDYMLYKPDGLKNPKGLVVVLHGCFQTGQQMSDGTGLTKLADTHEYYVLYPEQTYANNIWKCWNWFKKENLERDSGELSILGEMVAEIQAQFNIEAENTVVAGLSSGAAMASNLLACYADVFNGGLIHSGLEYMAATSESEAHNVLKKGSHRDIEDTATAAYKCSPKSKDPLRVIIVHGTSDPHVGTINSQRVFDQFLYLNDLRDDGRANASFVVSREDDRITGAAGQYSAKINKFNRDGDVIFQMVWVEGMGHAWSGGEPVAPYMDSRGVDVSKLMAEMFF